MKKWLYIVLCLLLPMMTRAQEQELSVAERNALQGFNDTIDRLADDFVTVSLVVASPGDVLYSILGHATIRMQCPTFGLDYIFTYESESVRGKVFRFLINDLKMGMLAVNCDEFLESYRAEGRGVKEYKLNLSPAQKQELWRLLDEKVAEGMELPYDYIKRGCATSCRQMIESVAYVQYSPATLRDTRTMREQFYDSAPKGWALLECMTIVGGQVDNPHLPAKQRLIAPEELVRAWQNATVDGRLLIDSEPTELLPMKSEKKEDAFPPLYAAIICLLLAVVGFVWQKPYVDYALLALQTLLGLLMLWLLISPLPGSEWSWLIVVFNPLPAICWHWRKYWALPYAVLIVIWCIAMVCAPHRLVDWAHILFALAFAVVLLKQSPVVARVLQPKGKK